MEERSTQETPVLKCWACEQHRIAAEEAHNQTRRSELVNGQLRGVVAKLKQALVDGVPGHTKKPEEPVKALPDPRYALLLTTLQRLFSYYAPAVFERTDEAARTLREVRSLAEAIANGQSLEGL